MVRWNVEIQQGTCLDVSHNDVGSSPVLITVLPVELGSVELKCCFVVFDITLEMKWVGQMSGTRREVKRRH